MKKILKFYLKHILSISMFIVSVIASFSAGWLMLLTGAALGALIFFFEWVLAIVFYKPSKKDIEKKLKENPDYGREYREDEVQDDFWVIGP